MELNEINESYKKQEATVKKVDTDKTKKAIETKKKRVIALTDKLEDLQTKKSRAERDNDSATVKNTEEEIKKTRETLLKVRNELKRLEDTLSKAKTELEGHIKLIEEMAKSNPELKAELDEALKTKFDRAVKRNKAQIETLSKQVEPIKIIRNAASKDPNVMYLIKDIEKQTKTIQEQEAILADPNKSNDEKSKAQATLDSAKHTLDSSRSGLASYFKGTIKREDIDRIQSLAGMDREIKSTDRKISSLNKQNENYETAIKNIEKAKEGKGDDKGRKSSKGDKGGLPATRPKWYQFIKRFKNWYHKYDPAPSKDEAEEPEKTDDDSKKSFKDSLKYDVVRDYKDKLEQQYLKDAKAQNKEARKEASKEDGPEL